MTDTTTHINLERVVDLLKERGHFAYVEQTGGGCATIFAGPTTTDEDGGKRYKIAAGPGWFERGSLRCDGMADTIEFVIGPDDDGDNGHVNATLA